MIKQLKEAGWNFNFIGANIDVEKVSRSMNIDNSMEFEQSCEGTRAMFEKEKKVAPDGSTEWKNVYHACLKTHLMKSLPVI